MLLANMLLERRHINLVALLHALVLQAAATEGHLLIWTSPFAVGQSTDAGDCRLRSINHRKPRLIKVGGR